MNIKEFAQELLDNTKLSAELNGVDFDEELATTIIEYIADTGEVNAPEICSSRRPGRGLRPTITMTRPNRSTSSISSVQTPWSAKLTMDASSRGSIT